MRAIRSAGAFIAGIVLANATLVGCGTYSIPRVAAQGTTITIPVPDWFGSGVGRVLNEYIRQQPYGPIDPITVSIQPNPTSSLEDFQRGELLFALRLTQSPASGLLTYLPVRYITRVQVDEASRASTPAPGETSSFEGTDPTMGQIVALVDIPYGVSPGNYYIFIERWKRNHPLDQDKFFRDAPTINSPEVDWLAWTGTVPFYGTPSPEHGMPIRIVASSFGSSLFNDSVLGGYDKFFGNYSWNDFTSELESLLPRPKLTVWVKHPTTSVIPAAWEAEIDYPVGKIEILGAELGALHRSGGFVGVGPPTGSPESCSSMGSTKVSVVDPDRQSAWVNIVYRLRDFEGCGRAGAGDFAIPDSSYKAYDGGGNPLASADRFIWVDESYSFR